jgi:hypothetical protein
LGLKQHSVQHRPELLGLFGVFFVEPRSKFWREMIGHCASVLSRGIRFPREATLRVSQANSGALQRTKF